MIKKINMLIVLYMLLVVSLCYGVSSIGAWDIPNLFVDYSTYLQPRKNTSMVLHQNLTVASSALFVDGDTARVGIGTLTPSGKFHVAGAIFIDSSIYLGDDILHLNVTAININESATFTNKSGVVNILLNASGHSWFTGGNVGIGTTSPTEKLDISGNINLSGVIKNSDGTAAAPAYTFFGDTDTGLRRASANNISLVTGGSDRITIRSSGYVGIGTTAPQYGQLVIGDTDVANKIGFAQSSASTARAFVGYVGISAIFGGGSGKSVNFYADNSVKMHITTTGNVGIGTTSPDWRLQVQGGMNVSNSLFVNSTSGKVGIGTTSPTSKLHIAGNVNMSAQHNITNIKCINFEDGGQICSGS